MTEAEKVEVTDDDHSEAVDFLCRHVDEDWSLDYLVANAIAETKHRIAHTAGDVEPVAWAYELAMSLTKKGGYAGWVDRVSFEQPKVPEDSIRHLTPLYAHPPAQAPTEQRQSEPSGDVAKPTYESTYAAFTDGMKAAAEICGSLAETTYDDTDAFEAATGCEAAIMRVVKEQRAQQRATLFQEQRPYLSDRFKWAAPGDRQEDVWLLRFCDNDIRDAIWTGPEAQSEAWAAWNRHAPGYNCYLFRLATMQEQRQEAATEGEGRAIELMRAYYAAEDARNDCPECENEGQWEHCGPCSERIGNAINDQLLFLARLDASAAPKERKYVRPL